MFQVNLCNQLVLNRKNNILLIEVNSDRSKIGAPMAKLINTSSCINGNRVHRSWVNDSTRIEYLPDVVIFSKPSVRAHQPNIS